MGSPDEALSRVLVVGQTPPPVGGQAVMIQRMLDHEYAGVELEHVRMAFSQEISDAGRFQARKLLHLPSVIIRVAWARVRHRTPTLYYPPAGPNLVPVMRDIAILLSTRWMFSKTIFHFHATDLPAIYPNLPRLVKPLFKTAYGSPDLAIVSSEYSVADGERVHAKRTIVVPNFVDSPASHAPAHERQAGDVCRLLFVGLVTPTKGVGDLLEAGAMLRDRGCRVEIIIVGKPVSVEYEEELASTIGRLAIQDMVTLTGELDPSDVESEYAKADVFVFPTHDRSENFGIVLLEAMSFGLPLVGSGDVGVRSIIRSGVNGIHVASGEVSELAGAIETLVRDPALAHAMGKAGMSLVLTDYSEAQFFASMRDAFLSLDRG